MQERRERAMAKHDEVVARLEEAKRTEETQSAAPKQPTENGRQEAGDAG